MPYTVQYRLGGGI